jgi:hypothetical protein
MFLFLSRYVLCNSGTVSTLAIPSAAQLLHAHEQARRLQYAASALGDDVAVAAACPLVNPTRPSKVYDKEV